MSPRYLCYCISKYNHKFDKLVEGKDSYVAKADTTDQKIWGSYKNYLKYQNPIPYESQVSYAYLNLKSLSQRFALSTSLLATILYLQVEFSLEETNINI